MRPILAALAATVMLANPARAVEPAPIYGSVPIVAANTALRLQLDGFGRSVVASRPRPAPVHGSSPTRVQSYAGGYSFTCGGSLPPCYVLMRESGGLLTARNPRSSASGKWQFLRSTWAGFGGYSEAWLAPAEVQDAKARIVWADGRGCAAWGAC